MGFVYDALSKNGSGSNPNHQPPADAALNFGPPVTENLEQATAPSPKVHLPMIRPEELPDGIDDRLVALTDPSSVMGEEYRGIRTRLLARWQQRRNLIHTITSATPKEGKTITSLNMGLSFSEVADRKTIVVECDLRIPMFEKMLPLEQGPGLIHLLSGESDLKQSIKQTPSPNLVVLPAGAECADDATQLLGSRAMTDLLNRLRQMYDHVILDTPPVIDLADAGIVGCQSDEVILVVRMNRTPRHLIDEAIRTLGSYDAPVSGSILTDRHQHTVGGEYGYRYSSYYRYSKRHQHSRWYRRSA